MPLDGHRTLDLRKRHPDPVVPVRHIGRIFDHDRIAGAGDAIGEFGPGLRNREQVVAGIHRVDPADDGFERNAIH